MTTTNTANEYNTIDTAAEVKAVEFDAEDILILDIFAPAEYDDADYGGDTWANQVCSGFGHTLYATDYDGTTTGDPKGINVLILRADLEAWEESCDGLGCEFSPVWDVASGHYGDGNWNGVDLAVCETRRGTKYFWFER
jgi:hypothetical protein